MTMDCKHFPSCNASLCPLDPELDSRTWFVGECICKRMDFAAFPMVRRQKQFNKKRPGKYSERPLYAEWLRRTAPKKRSFSPEHLSQLRDRMKKMRKITDHREMTLSTPP
jgi:hypothetical protein